MNVIICSVCGYPIVGGGCLHTAMGVDAEEWRARRAAQAPERFEPQAAVTGCARIAALGGLLCSLTALGLLAWLIWIA